MTSYLPPMDDTLFEPLEEWLQEPSLDILLLHKHSLKLLVAVEEVTDSAEVWKSRHGRDPAHGTMDEIRMLARPAEKLVEDLRKLAEQYRRAQRALWHMQMRVGELAVTVAIATVHEPTTPLPTPACPTALCVSSSAPRGDASAPQDEPAS